MSDEPEPPTFRVSILACGHWSPYGTLTDSPALVYCNQPGHFPMYVRAIARGTLSAISAPEPEVSQRLRSWLGNLRRESL